MSKKDLTTLAKEWLKFLRMDQLDDSSESPFPDLPPVAKAIAWLILGHHRLPAKRSGNLRPVHILNPWKSLRADWGYSRDCDKKSAIEKTWKIKPGDLPCFSSLWAARAGKMAAPLLNKASILSTNWLDNTYVMHVGRMGLMLADHVYSSRKTSQGREEGYEAYQPYANTAPAFDPATGEKKRALCQKLDEHLIGVERLFSNILWRLGRLRGSLPVIGALAGKRFRKRADNPRFRWQDKAYELAESIAERSSTTGFFGVNMASTGCGKTIANGKICFALSGRLGARFTIALGLRTLTFQTGDVYGEQMKLGQDELAVLAGDRASRELHERSKEAEKNSPESGEEDGAESSETFFSGAVQYEGALDGPINEWFGKNPGAAALVCAPALVCTIDHLVPATEGVRGGRQIAPMMRLMTSDLVLDEPDDFDVDDLHALSRLVHWAGMLGSRAIISSATLTPAFARGLFAAYKAGRAQYNANMGYEPDQPVICGWFDEFSCGAIEASSEDEFAVAHLDFAAKRLKKLARLETRRVPAIVKLDEAPENEEECLDYIAGKIKAAIEDSHSAHHTTDKITGKRISFGLVRMANIEQLVKTVRRLVSLGANSGTHWHICCYHSQYPMLARSALERKLDKLLNRKCSDEEFFARPVVQNILSGSRANDHIVIVLATPVAEVGRDHDYDWAIAEPSSMRSIIQLAGRVRRHREGRVEKPNIQLLDTNWRALKNAGTGGFSAAYKHPGFENSTFRLANHNLSTLLTEEQLTRLDSGARIVERKPLATSMLNENTLEAANLADLEHAVLTNLMLENETNLGKNIRIWQKDHATMTGEIQKQTRFRSQTQEETYFFDVDDNGDELTFSRIEDDGDITRQEALIVRTQIEKGLNISWLDETDYLTELRDMADKKDMTLCECAKLFGKARLRSDNVSKWYYHPRLGFYSKE